MVDEVSRPEMNDGAEEFGKGRGKAEARMQRSGGKSRGSSGKGIMAC
jgi:hypothetical protein